MWARAYGAVELCRAIAVTTTVNKTGVDLTTYADLGRREMKAIVDLGAFTTTATATIAITNAPTSGGAYVAPAYGTSSVVATAAGVHELNFRADQPFVRVEITVDAAGSVPMSVVGVVLKREANS